MDGACTVWTGAICPRGYGKRWFRSKWQLAHRVAWIETKGDIPAGLTVDHLCFNTLCVNPDHLRLLTLSDNSRNQRSATKTHCVNGHEFTPENTYTRPQRYRTGKRDCRACIRDRVAKYQAKQREAA